MCIASCTHRFLMGTAQNFDALGEAAAWHLAVGAEGLGYGQGVGGGGVGDGAEVPEGDGAVFGEGAVVQGG